MIRHRGTCEAPGCGRVWRENCEDCLREVTERHRAETGHSVHLQISSDDTSTVRLQRMTRQAHQMVFATRRWGQ